MGYRRQENDYEGINMTVERSYDLEWMEEFGQSCQDVTGERDFMPANLLRYDRELDTYAIRTAQEITRRI